MIRTAVLAASITFGSAHASAPPPRFAMGTSAASDVAVPVASMLDRRYAEVVRQQYDFSCGSAALATLLRYHYDYAVAEDQAFRGMWARGDQDAIRRVGFSLLDMKRWLASRGLASDGYKVDLDQIAKTGVPGIALIQIKNYKHFVVVKGVNARELLLGDPSTGLTIMPRAAFEAAWNGIYFVLTSEQPRAKSRFNRPQQWAAFARAPVGHAFSAPVGLAELSLTAPFYREF